MTSATEHLRALLTEHGVEWWQSANTLGCIFTRWRSPIFGDEVVAMENGEEGLVLFDHFVTPEQAIDATLGRGTCHIDLVGYDEREDRFQCRSCDWSISVRRGTWPRFNYCPNCGRKVVE